MKRTRHPDPQVTVSHLTDPLAWQKLEPEWDDLLRSSAADTVFLSWAWLWRWWETRDPGTTIRVIAVRDSTGRLVAAAPLCLRPSSSRGVPWGRELAFLASGEAKSDYLDIIVRREEEVRWRQALLESLLASPGWDVLRLEGILEESPTLAALRALLPEFGLRGRVAVEEAAPFLPLPTNGAGGTDPIRPKFRSAIRRQQRALERLGKVEFEIVGDPAALPAALETFAALNRSRLGVKGIEGGFRLERFAAFQRAVAGDLFPSGRLRLCLLKLDAKPIAALWILAYGGKYLYYQSGLDGDPAWSRFSPGTIILSLAIEQAMLEGMLEFDFLRGEEVYKTRFTNRSRRLMRLIAYRRTPFGLLAGASDRAAGLYRRLRGRTPEDAGR